MNSLQYGTLKMILVTLVAFIGIIFALPNVLPESVRSELPSWLKPMALGLDLRGVVRDDDAAADEFDVDLLGEILDWNGFQRHVTGAVEVGPECYPGKRIRSRSGPAERIRFVCETEQTLSRRGGHIRPTKCSDAGDGSDNEQIEQVWSRLVPASHGPCTRRPT